MNNHGYYRDDGCESDCATHNEPAYPNGECDCIASLSQRLRKLSAENKGPRDCIDEAADALDRLKQDSERLEWLMRNVSGKEFRRLGVIYGGNCGRDRIDAAMKVCAGDTAPVRHNAELRGASQLAGAASRSNAELGEED